MGPRKTSATSAQLPASINPPKGSVLGTRHHPHWRVLSSSHPSLPVGATSKCQLHAYFIYMDKYILYMLFEYTRVRSVAQSCLTLCDPMDCSPPGSSVHGIL